MRDPATINMVDCPGRGTIPEVLASTCMGVPVYAPIQGPAHRWTGTHTQIVLKVANPSLWESACFLLFEFIWVIIPTMFIPETDRRDKNVFLPWKKRILVVPCTTYIGLSS